MNNTFDKPYPSPVPSIAPRASTESAKISLPDLEAHARLINEHFEFLAKWQALSLKTSYAELEEKMKAFTEREKNCEGILKQAAELKTRSETLDTREKDFDLQRDSFVNEQKVERKKIDDERIAILTKQVEPELPKFLKREEAAPLFGKILVVIDSSKQWKNIRSLFGLAAFAEETKDAQTYLFALDKIFPLLRDSGLKGNTSSIVEEIGGLITRGNDFGFEIKTPKVRELFSKDSMNGPLNIRDVSEVHSWAVYSSRENKWVKKAEVK